MGAGIDIRPRRDFSRRFLIRVQPSRYYDETGFEIRGDRVIVKRFFGKPLMIPRERIRAVVCAYTRLRSGDWRVLLVGEDNRVLARVWGPFFTDEDLRRLAEHLSVPYRQEQFRSFARLMDRYPGALRYRWERHPALGGALLTIPIFALVVIGVAIAHLL